MIYYFDIDNTLCETKSRYGKNFDSTDYEAAVPIKKNIAAVNSLYDEGHKIVLWTSRGVGSGRELRDFTVRQLAHWGVKYHKLRMDKPLFDIFVDDKAMNAREWERQN